MIRSTKPNHGLDAEELRAVLTYDPETGVFVWLKSRYQNRPQVGSVAGARHSNGYTTITVNQKMHMAHRLAWLFVRGDWPAVVIDHINGDRSDNRIVNLRAVGFVENGQNQRRAHVDSRTGFLGVRVNGNRYAARISIGGRNRNLGNFKTAEEAHAAYVVAKRSLHEGNTL